MVRAVHDVSVVICAYTEERWDELVAAVASVQHQSLPAQEIVVVIDHNPGLLERARLHLPQLAVVENNGPRGLSGARNSGVAAAQGAFVAFLDDDAVAAPDWLERLRNRCDDPRVLGVGGSSKPFWLSARPVWFPEEFYWVIGCTYRGLPRTTTAVRNPFGGCSCIRREIFETAGGYRSEVGRVGERLISCDETEFSIRVSRHHRESIFLYDPAAVIHHNVPPYRASWHYFRSRCYFEGRSKAVVTRFVGIGDGLASERSYTLRTLPRGVLRGVADTFTRGDISGLARAGVIIAGLAITITGYIGERLGQLRRDTKRLDVSASPHAIGIPRRGMETT